MTSEEKNKIFKLLSSETILEDDYPIVPCYVYICDGLFTRYDGQEEVTVGVWKRERKIAVIRRCALFDHEGARLGDRVA